MLASKKRSNCGYLLKIVTSLAGVLGVSCLIPPPAFSQINLPLGAYSTPNSSGIPSDIGSSITANGTTISSNGWVFYPNGTTISSDGWVFHPNRTIISPDGWVSHPTGTIISPVGWVSNLNGTLVSPSGEVITLGSNTTTPGTTATTPSQ